MLAAAGPAAGGALTELRLRPLHLGASGLVLGLLAGPRAPVVVLGALLLCPLVAGRALGALALAAAVLGGAMVADARLAALDHSRLGPRLGHAATERAVLLERRS